MAPDSTLQPNDLDEVMLRALESGRRAHAVLIRYRQRGSDDLGHAWSEVNALVENSAYDAPEQDPSFQRVQDYLDGLESSRDTKFWLLAAAAFLSVGALIMAFKLPALCTGVASYRWPTAEAEIINVRLYEERRRPQNQERDYSFMDFRYKYQVGDTDHVRSVFRRPYHPPLGDEAYQVGQRINVLYNPNRPDQSLARRNMYQRFLPVALGFLITIPGIAMVAFYLFQRWNAQDLRRHDPDFS